MTTALTSPVDRPGTFRANITGYGLKEMDSGAIAVAITCELLSMWHENAWIDWPAGGMQAEGDIWIVKTPAKGGGLNENGVKSLVNFAGWDGNIESIVNETWQPTPCVVVVQDDTYKEKLQRRIAFVNDYNRTPGGLSNVDATKAKELQARFGGQLRAIAGTKAHNGTAPANRPVAPPPMAPPPPQLVDSDGRDIPF